MAFGIMNKMDGEKNPKDLEEDEELSALRMAALATLKRNVPKPETAPIAIHISTISSIITNPSTSVSSAANHVRKDFSDRYNGQYKWRKPQPVRRRGGVYSLSNQRPKNLIVINPVSVDDQAGKPSILSLPQDKWCHSGNEDSMSPKAYRRTGPTRFNRHESDSDSSDSEMDNSDNGSCSNETVLQDEPSVNYSHASHEESNDGESGSVPEKEPFERRLSFHNLDSDLSHSTFPKNDATSVYNCLKSNYSYDSVDERPGANYNASTENKNDSGHTQMHDADSTFTKYGSAQNLGNDNYMNKQSNSTVNLYSNVKSMMNDKYLNKQTDSTLHQSPINDKYQGKQLDISNDTSKSYSENRTTLTSSTTQEIIQLKDYRTKKVSENCDIAVTEKYTQKCSEILEKDTSYAAREISYCKDFKEHVKSSRKFSSETRNKSLSQSDLRLELQKRIQDFKSSKTSSFRNESRTSRLSDDQSYENDSECSQRGSSLRNRGHIYERNRETGARSRGRGREYSQCYSSRSHDRSRSADRSRRASARNRSRSCDLNKNHHGTRTSSSRSRSSSSSSCSSTSSGTSGSSPVVHSVPSVIKPVLPKASKDVKTEVLSDCKSTDKKSYILESDCSSLPVNKTKDINDVHKLSTSNAKITISGGDAKNNDTVKRVPVHMRLGILPRKRVIQMTKDVEAAFVNSSSDDENDVNMKCKKQNIRIVTKVDDGEACNADKYKKLDISREKSRKLKTHR